MGITTSPLTKDAFLTIDLDIVLSEAREKLCHHYFKIFAEKYQELKEAESSAVYDILRCNVKIVCQGQ
jgi:hypothetical protein